MSDTMIFSAEELRRLRDSILSRGVGEGRKRERDDMARRLADIRRYAQESGGTYKLPIMEPIAFRSTSDPFHIERDSVLIAEFTVVQIRALETLFCGRSEV